MIDTKEIISWLNEEKKLSQIPLNLRLELDDLSKLPPLLRVGQTSRLIRRVNSLDPGSQKAELLVHCAALRYEEGAADSGCFEEANELIIGTDDYYRGSEDLHRQAVTGFLRSMILKPLRQFSDSAMYARQSLAYFIENANYLQSKDSYKKKRAVKIAADLVNSHSDAYDFLFRFSQSRLCISAKQIQTQLRESIEKSNFVLINESARIRREMKCLNEIMDHNRPDRSDKGEALAYCGLVLWIIEDRVEAAETLKRALDNYNPRDAEYPLISWMSGIMKAYICLDVPAQNTKDYRICSVINGLEKCVYEMDALQQRFDRANQPSSANWYACLKDSMQVQLKGLANRACTAPV
jgi:hypothetical protein